MNPNVLNKSNENPLASIFGFMGINPVPDYSEVINFLVKYGADCNLHNEEYDNVYAIEHHYETPFMQAVWCRCFDYADIMAEKGNADVNLALSGGITITIMALYNEIEYSNLLSTLLRCIVYPADSKEYQMKLEIIQEFERQGVNYYNEPVPEEIKKQIQNLYPDTWEEYIKVY